MINNKYSKQVKNSKYYQLYKKKNIIINKKNI
jgi:hypothetical protein